MDDKYFRLTKNIKKLRDHNKMTQQRLGELLHVEAGTVSKWEKGINYPLDHLQEIARIFNISVDKLLGEDIPNPTDPISCFETIETFALPNRYGVFADLIKDYTAENYIMYLYDFHYGGIKLIMDYRPFENYTPNLFKEEFLATSDEFLHSYRDRLDSSGLCDISPEERALIEETESGFDDIEAMHKDLGID